MPKVSILIPIYNDEKFIKDLVDSVLGQTFKDFECLFYNHGSTDGSGKLLQSLTKDDKRVKIIESKKNIGNGANNELLKHAKGEYIKFFCADDLMMKNCIEKQVLFFDSDTNKKYSVLFTKTIKIDNNALEIYKDNKDVKNKNRYQYLNYIFYKGNPEFSFPTLMIRRSSIKNNRLFDERFGQINDVNLWLKLLLAGNEFYILNDYLVKYRWHSNNISNLQNINAKARFIFEFQRLFEIYLKEINSFEELLRIFPEAKEFNKNLNKTDNDLIPFIICQLALRVDKKIFPFLEVHKNFAMSELFTMMGNKKIADKIYKNFNFSYSDFKNLTLHNPNSLELAYFFNKFNLDYSLLKQKRGFFGLLYRIKKKMMKSRSNNLSKAINKSSC